MTNLRYVEMLCNLTAGMHEDITPPAGVSIRPLDEADKDQLYTCYHAAFAAGDARFFFDQDKQEREEYFGTLGLDEALGHPASATLWQDQQLIGFAYVLPYGEDNCHISCMCIHPDFRRKGLGSLLLHHVMGQAAQDGYLTISLGTETEMAAYHLYREHGFRVTQKSSL